MDFESLGRRIKEVRKSKHLSLEALADLTHINKSMLSRYENGKSMEVYNLVTIAYHLKTSLDYLVFGNGPMTLTDKKIVKKSFGEEFVKAISTLSRKFAVGIEKQLDKEGYETSNKMFCVYLGYKTYPLGEICEGIANLYETGNYMKSSSFAKYEKDVLDKYANQIDDTYENDNEE